MTLDFYDGSSDDIKNKLFSRVFSIRIVYLNQTSYTLNILKDDLPIYGDVDLVVSDNIKSNFNIEISPENLEALSSQILSFSASVDQSISDCTYYWYLDGKKQLEESNVLTLNEELPLGKHFVDVIGYAAGVLSSASTSFTIKDTLDSYMDVTLFEVGTENIVKSFMLTCGPEDYSQYFNGGDTLTLSDNLHLNKITDLTCDPDKIGLVFFYLQ